MNIKEQIERLRRSSTHPTRDLDCKDAADTLERLYAVYEAAKKWENTYPYLPDNWPQHEADTALCDAIAAVGENDE